MTWPFGDLRPLSYDLIMIDCAWRFDTWSQKGQGKSPDAHYQTMSMEEIAALPVADLARGNAVFFIWAVWPRLHEIMDLVRDGWGLRYASGGVWVKRTKHGKLAFGNGYRLRSASEPWILATIGNPVNSRSHRNVIEGPVREHSRKPDEAYAWCESYLPGALRRADVYSRQTRPGWEASGLEIGKFDTGAPACEPPSLLSA